MAKTKTTVKKTKTSKKINITVDVNVTEEKKPATKTKIALVIDRSGSMGGVRNQAFSGINEQLETIKRNAGETDTEVSYVQFDDVVELVFKKPAKELRGLEYSEYIPRGSTALYDAVWTTINKLDNGSQDKETAYLVIVISDGWENASKLVTQQKLAEKVRQLEATGQWTFTYMMSNINLSEFNSTVHANIGNSVSWTATAAGMNEAFRTVNNSTAKYLGDRAMFVGASYSKADFYTDPTLTGGSGVSVTVNNNTTDAK
jgi:uncharacterized protein YegL